MNALNTLVAAIVIGALAVVGFSYSGIYDVGADVSRRGPIDWLLSTTSHASVARRAKDIEVPNLENDALVLAGVNDFEGMTGMPAWGATHEDDEIWPVVALMMALPTLDADAHRALLRSASGVGHSTPGHRKSPSVDDPPVDAEEHNHANHSH